MQDIQDIAAKFAEGRGATALDKMIAGAYAEGYRDGYKAREKELPVNFRSLKTEYVDVGLSCLWSSDFEREPSKGYVGPCKLITCTEASHYCIPTLEQFHELMQSCRWSYNKVSFTPPYKPKNTLIDSFTCLGPSSNKITFKAEGYQGAPSERIDLYKSSYFWIKDEDKVIAAVINCNLNNDSISYLHNEVFPGFRLPVRLVRQK